MKKSKVVIISIVLGLSLGAAVQFGVINAVGNGAMSFFNGVFPGNVGTHVETSSTAGNGQYLSGPAYQGTNSIQYFDTNLQSSLLATSFSSIDGGFTQQTQTNAAVAGYTYFDFETGISSTTSFTTADFYWDISGNQWNINTQNGALQKNVGIVPLNSVNANTYLNTRLSKNDIKGNPPTWKVANDTVYIWQTAEGNALKMRLNYFGNPLLITYSQIYEISIDGNANFLAQASANGWTGNGTASNPIVIQNNNFTSSEFGGFSIYNTNLYFTVQNNVFNGLGTSLTGVTLNNVTNGKFVGNTIENYGIGVLAVNTSNLGFDSNTVTGNAQEGVSVQNSTNISFTNNTVSNNGESGFLAYKTTLLVVDSNTFSGNSQNVVTDPTILSGSVTFAYSSGTISNNVASANDGYGVLVFGSDGTTVSGNTVTGSAQDGVYVLGSNSVTVSSNTVDSNVGNGVTVSSAEYTTVSGNTITNNGQDGLHWVNSSYGTIQNNTLVGNSNLALLYAKTGSLNLLSSYSGLFMDPSYWNTVDGNNMSVNGLGAYLSGSDLNTFTNNVFTNNAEDGLSVINSSSNIVSSNTFSGNSNPNTYLSMSSYLKPGSVNLLSSYSGLFMDPSSNNTISNNAFTNNYGYGVHLLASDYNTITSNTVTGNGFDGAFVENSNWNQFTQNTFSQNSNPTLQSAYLQAFKPSSTQLLSSYSGLFMDPSHNNNVTGNTFDSNYGNGLYLSVSDLNSINLNQMNNNALNGLFVENSSNNNILSNTLTGNSNPALLSELLSFGKPSNVNLLSSYSGLFMDPSNNNDVSNNHITNNFGYGTWLQGSNNNLFDTNTVTGNGYDGLYVANSNYNSITNNDLSANSNPNLQQQFLDVMNSFKPSSVQLLSSYSGLFMDPSIGNSVSNNIINNNPGYGVWVQSSSNNVFDSNIIANSGQDGFFLQESSYNNVTNNLIHGSGNTAVMQSFLNFGKPTNVQLLSSYSGLFMDPSSNNVIAYNNMSANTGYGVYSQDSNTNAIGYNQISYNTLQGIYASNSSDMTIMGNSFAYNVQYGTYFDANSHNSNVNHNDFLANSQSNSSQAFDDGGNSFDSNFLLDANPNTAYTIAGTAGSTDPSPSYVPIGNLNNYNFPPLAINAVFTSSSFNVLQNGNYLDAHLYFPSGYSAYLTNESTVFAVWNGHYYPMLAYNVQSTSAIHVKFNATALGSDVNAYFLANGITSATITVTFTGEFNGGFMAFYGSDTTLAFN